jgi:anti-sigma-K factor RskA
MTPEQDIDRILTSLDGAQRAEAGPYLYSKIRGRLDRSSSAVAPALAWRLALVVAIVAVLNLYTLASFAPQKQTQTETTAAAVATDYSISLPTAY